MIQQGSSVNKKVFKYLPLVTDDSNFRPETCVVKGFSCRIRSDHESTPIHKRITFFRFYEIIKYILKVFSKLTHAIFVFFMKFFFKSNSQILHNPSHRPGVKLFVISHRLKPDQKPNCI